MAPGNMALLWLLTLTSGISESRQFSTSTAGNVPLSEDSGLCCLHTSTLFGPPFYLGRYGRSVLIYTKRHNFIYYAITRPVCLFAGVFGAQDVI